MPHEHPRRPRPPFPGTAEEQHALARRHEAIGVPLWMTECGAFLPARPRPDLTPAQEVVQARYLVRSTVEGLAAGNARQFWFAGPPLHDDGAYFGLMDREFGPLPAYSAFAALSALLGAARCVGRAGELPSGAEGFVFDSGRGDLVTVVWATEPVRVSAAGAGWSVRAVGGTRVWVPTGGRSAWSSWWWRGVRCLGGRTVGWPSGRGWTVGARCPAVWRWFT